MKNIPTARTMPSRINDILARLLKHRPTMEELEEIKALRNTSTAEPLHNKKRKAAKPS